MTALPLGVLNERAEFERPPARHDAYGGDPRYLAFFDCFNRQLFYEAHDKLEPLWLTVRQRADGNFFKGLIQLAGAFVHVQKGRSPPARALLRLARANLVRYPDRHHRLSVPLVLDLVEDWLCHLEGDASASHLLQTPPPPQLRLTAFPAPERTKENVIGGLYPPANSPITNP